MSKTLALDRVKQIVELHAECEGLARQTFDKAVVIGGLLAEAKADLKHGEWLPWVEANLPFTDRTARNYMRLHDRRGEFKSETVSDLTGAYRMLTEPKDEEISPPKAGGDDELYVPEPGCCLTGHHHHEDGSHETIFIEPHKQDGFYFVAYMHSLGEELGATIDGNIKGFRPEWVKISLEKWSHRTPLNSYSWQQWEVEPRDYNFFLFDSEEDYVQQCILGRPKTWAEDDRKKYEALKSDIATNGVLIPVAVDEGGSIIDGFKRVQACEELGKDFPITAYFGLSEDDKEGLESSLNGWKHSKPYNAGKRLHCRNVKEFERGITALVELAKIKAKAREVKAA